MSYTQALKDRLAESLDPEMQERYKARRKAAMEQQDANYQGPEAVQALGDGQRTRALYAGLARAANQFGSVGGDGGPKTTVPETMADFDKAAVGDFTRRQDAYQSGVKGEDDAVSTLSSLNSSAVSGLKGLEDLEKNQADEDYLNAPVDEYTRALGEDGLKRLNMSGKVPWDKVTRRDVERNPFLKNLVASTTKAADGKPVYQKLRDADGVIRVYAVYPDGRKEPVGDAGFAGQVRTDPATGGLITIDPNKGNKGNGSSQGGAARPSSSVPGQSASVGVNTTMLPGETPKQRDARVELETAKAKKDIEKGAKEDSEFTEAATEQYRVGALTQRLRKLRDGAFFTGPVGGRVGQKLNEFGVSAGKADKLNQSLSKELSDYIKATTGASATEQEMARLQKFIPSSNDTDDLFENKMQGLEENVQAIVNEKLAKRRGASQAPSPQQSQAPKSWRDIKK